MTRALLFSRTTSAWRTSSRNAALPSGLARSMHTPRLLRFISLKYMARCHGWRCWSCVGPTHTSARVAGRVAHSILTLSAPRSARNRPATGPAQFVVTSTIFSPSNGARPATAGRSLGGGAHVVGQHVLAVEHRGDGDAQQLTELDDLGHGLVGRPVGHGGEDPVHVRPP